MGKKVGGGGNIGEEPLLQGISSDEDRVSPSEDPPILGVQKPGQEIEMGAIGGEYEPLETGDGLVVAIPEVLEGKASVNSCVSNLANAMLGAGLLTFPRAFANASLTVGLILLMVCATISYEGYRCLLQCYRLTKKNSYKLIAVSAFGKRAGTIISTLLCVQTIGTMTAYTVLVGDFSSAIVANIAPEGHWSTSRKFLMPALAVCVLAPLSLLRSLHALRHTSSIAVFSIFFAVFTISERFFERGPHQEVEHFSVGPKLMSSIPLISLSLSGHMVLVPIVSELAPKAKHKSSQVVSVSVVLCTTLYAITGTFGQLTFGRDVDGNVLNSYADNDVLASIARFGFLLVIIFSYPIICLTHRSNLNSLLFGEGVAPLQRHIATTVVPILLALGIAMVVPGVAFVFGLNGAICGSTVAMVIPGVLYARLAPGPMLSGSKWRPITLACTGVVLAFVGAFATIGNQLKWFGD